MAAVSSTGGEPISAAEGLGTVGGGRRLALFVRCNVAGKGKIRKYKWASLISINSPSQLLERVDEGVCVGVAAERRLQSSVDGTQ